MGRFSKANKKTFIIDLATVDSKKIDLLLAEPNGKPADKGGWKRQFAH